MRFRHLLLCLLPMLYAPQVADAQGLFRWMLAGSSQAYTMSADGSPMSDQGATVSLRSTSPTPTGFGAVTGMIDADTLAGRRVRISADIETRDVPRSASLWLRADSGSTTLILDNAMDRGIKGTTSVPTHFDVTMNVPSSATRLAFGLLLAGGGEASARNVRFTV